jgi:hypothetical protein
VARGRGLAARRHRRRGHRTQGQARLGAASPDRLCLARASTRPARRPADPLGRGPGPEPGPPASLPGRCCGRGRSTCSASSPTAPTRAAGPSRWI